MRKKWAKIYSKRKSSRKLFPWGRKGFGNLTFNSFSHHNFLFISLNQNCKIILNIYASRNFQWYEKHLIWIKFIPCIFLSNLLPWNNLVTFSPRIKQLTFFSSGHPVWGSCLKVIFFIHFVYEKKKKIEKRIKP